MSKAIRIHKTGDESVLRWEETSVPPLAAAEVLVRHHAIGINFIDIYHRTGLYPLELPAVLGMEGAGVIEEVGKDVKDFQAGDGVAYCTSIGSYAERRSVAAEHLVRLPEDINYEQAAAMMLKGMTAEYLIRRTYRVKRGDMVLFHAIAGGVGLLALQWLKQLGAFVIGTASTAAKKELALEHGCDEVLIHKEADIVQRVKDLTQGEGVAVVYDSIGKDTFAASLDSLRPRGLLVSYGNASGAVPSFSPHLLAQKGSLFLTRPTLFHYVNSAAARRQSAAQLFAAYREGMVVSINQRYPLAKAAEAHRAMAERRTTGSGILLP